MPLISRAIISKDKKKHYRQFDISKAVSGLTRSKLSKLEEQYLSKSFLFQHRQCYRSLTVTFEGIMTTSNSDQLIAKWEDNGHQYLWSRWFPWAFDLLSNRDRRIRSCCGTCYGQREQERQSILVAKGHSIQLLALSIQTSILKSLKLLQDHKERVLIID